MPNKKPHRRKDAPARRAREKERALARRERMHPVDPPTAGRPVREPDTDEPVLDEPVLDEDGTAITERAAWLRKVVATVLRTRDGRAALRVVLALERTAEDEGDDEASRDATRSLSVLLGWLSGARDTEPGSPALAEAAVSWVGRELGADAERNALAVAGALGHPEPGDVVVSDVIDRLGDDFFPALVWLTAGLVATAGDGDVAWLRRFDPAAS